MVITLLFLLALALDIYPGLRGGSGWQWTYNLPDNKPSILILTVILAIYITGAIAIRHYKRAIWLNLAWSMLGATTIALGVVGIRGNVGFLLFTRTVSPVQTGASTLAVRTMAHDGLQPTLERWVEVMQEAFDANLIHFTTSPPGQPIIHYAAAKIFDEIPIVSQPLSMALRPYQCSTLEVMRYTRGELLSVMLGMLMPLWAALTVIPIYFSARLLLSEHSETSSITALNIAQWWALIPSVLLFAPTWNTLYPFLCISSFTLLLYGMSKQNGVSSHYLYFAAGLIMSFTTFLNFAVLPVFLLFGLFTLGYTYTQNKSIMWALQIGLVFSIGLMCIWVLFWMASGLTPLDIAKVTFDSHEQLVKREYLPWLVLHPYDVLMFTGFPLAIMFLSGAGVSLLKLKNNRVASNITPLNILAISTLLTFVALDFSGTVQGENARILSFYVPFFLLAGSHFFTRSSKWDVPLMITQALTVLVMASVLTVVPLDLNPQPQAPRTDMTLLNEIEPIPANIVFKSSEYEGEFILEGYRFIADVGAQAITLETIWRGSQQTERPYAFEITARAHNDIDGDIVAPIHHWYAQNENFLPTCWQQGEIIHDVTVISLPVISAPVVWLLELQAVDERTGDITHTLSDDGTTSTGYILSPVKYP